MNPYALTALVALAVAATAQYYIGTRRNRAIAARLSGELEEVLRPKSTNYVNIGGTIGYNFAYAMPEPWTKAKGTFTINARHSLLYLPVSVLFGVRDRFFINLFTKRRLKGEGHAVAASFLRKANIDGVEAMERRDVEVGGKSFVLLWRGAKLGDELLAALEAFPEPARLRHFCAYPETKTFFLHTLPKEGQVKASLESILRALPRFQDGKEE